MKTYLPAVTVRWLYEQFGEPRGKMLSLFPHALATGDQY
jgi:hypothetical protein